MNVLTLIGAAAVCNDFCKLLVKDPIKAAEQLNISLNYGEVAQLETIFGGKSGEELCAHLEKLSGIICPRPPCPFMPVTRDKLFSCGSRQTAA